MWSARRLLSSLRRKGEMANHIPAVGPNRSRFAAAVSFLEPGLILPFTSKFTSLSVGRRASPPIPRMRSRKLLQGKSNTFVEITKTGHRSAKFGTGGEVLNRCNGLFLRGYPEPWPLGCTFLRRISFPRAALTRITNVGPRKSGSRVAE